MSKDYQLENKVYKRLYSIWNAMKARCYNKNHPAYKYYGGRGIILSKEWRYDFKQFRDWAIKNGFKEGLSIDRIDNDKNYEPSNCRWVCISEQSKHRHNSIKLEYKGQTKSLYDISKELGINYGTLYYRYAISNMSLEDALKKEVANMPTKLPASNERYIHKNKWGYSVTIHKKYYGNRKDLQEAIKLRNAIIKELEGK